MTGASLRATSTPAPSWRGIFRDLPREHGFEPLRVEGELPAELRGTLYRNGPARFRAGGRNYAHWFDGDGAVTAVRIGEGRAEGACRFTDTPWLQRERSLGRPIYRGYAELGSGWRRFFVPKNPANIGVLAWQGTLATLWDAGRPIELDPNTLATRGLTSLGGVLGPTFSAHPHVVGDTLFNFAVRPGLRFELELFAWRERLRELARVPLARPTAIHDFIATPHHLVFFVPPLHLHVGKLAFGRGSYDANLAWEPGHGTEVIVVPLADPRHPIRFEVPAFFQWHFVHAWEPTPGRIVIDYVPYDDFSTDAWFGRAPYVEPRPPPRSCLARATLEPATRTMHVERLDEVSCEFPSIDPRSEGRAPAQIWSLCFGREQGSDGLHPVLAAFEPATRRWRSVPMTSESFPSEALVVPGRARDYVLSLVYEGERDASHVAIVDAARPEDGAIAKLWFDHAIPLGFHGAWSGAC